MLQRQLVPRLSGPFFLSLSALIKLLILRLLGVAATWDCYTSNTISFLWSLSIIVMPELVRNCQFVFLDLRVIRRLISFMFYFDFEPIGVFLLLSLDVTIHADNSFSFSLIWLVDLRSWQPQTKSSSNNIINFPERPHSIFFRRILDGQVTYSECIRPSAQWQVGYTVKPFLPLIRWFPLAPNPVTSTSCVQIVSHILTSVLLSQPTVQNVTSEFCLSPTRREIIPRRHVVLSSGLWLCRGK